VSSTLLQNQARLDARIEAACARAGRVTRDVQMLPVTKSVEPARAAALFALGQHELAENRADELERKCAWFAAQRLEARWHYVGHLQRNKARRVVKLAAEIHSIDSAALLDTVARVALEERVRVGVYLQVKLWPEESKGGCAPSEVPALCATAAAAPALELLGLMTIAPLLEDDDAARAAAQRVFGDLRRLAQTLDPALFGPAGPRLSMGMSDDFEIAIAEGAHVLRIGSALFEGVIEPPLRPLDEERATP
jgi:pyridoxal phosphate enzyme (YggS family)